GQFDVAINWTGGWHHAKRDEASGFCYINDIVCHSTIGLTAFFPGSGDSDDIGAGPGRFASVNVPLKEGVSDAQFAASFAAVIDAAFEAFDPGAVVCVSAAPMPWQQTSSRAGRPAAPGGGGYHFPSTAKLWTAITALAVGVDLDKDIPEHSFFSQYGPDFCLDVTPSLKRNLNDSTELRLLVESAVENLKRLAEALQLQTPMQPNYFY
uniref:Histone deacetylase n=1 Tax=Macrostomum lignano TaxID=282301 RepID=A0A1I8JPQ1_9PLAT